MSMSQEPTGLNLKTENHENFMYRGAWWATYNPWGHKELDTLKATEQLRAQKEVKDRLQLFEQIKRSLLMKIKFV